MVATKPIQYHTRGDGFRVRNFLSAFSEAAEVNRTVREYLEELAVEGVSFDRDPDTGEYQLGREGGHSQDDSNPRKDITRKMIQLLRVVNANFPETGVYPAGKQEVTCYTCHHGDPHPESLSNHRYQGPIPPRP